MTLIAVDRESMCVCKRERDANLNILTLGEQMGAAPVGVGWGGESLLPN